MMLVKLIAVHVALLAGASAQDGPVSVGLEGKANGQGFPVLHIHLAREGEDLGAVYVRFPEAIEANTATGKHLKFYQDIRSPEWPAKLECEPSLPVAWMGDESDTGYAMALDNGMALEARATLVKNEVRLSYSLTNGTDTALSDVRIWSCVQLHAIPELADPLMERTAVPLADGFTLMRDRIPTFTSYPREAAVNHRFHGYMTGVAPFSRENPAVFPHPGHPDDPAKAVRFWHVPEPIARPAIATTSRDGSWTVSTVAEHAPCVWTNPGISCHHADPVGESCAPGDAISICTRVRFVRGGLSALLGTVDEDRLSK